MESLSSPIPCPSTQTSWQSPVGPDLHTHYDGELALSLINSGW